MAPIPCPRHPTPAAAIPPAQPPARALWQIYLLFLAPMVLSNLLQSLSGTLNGIYIGQMLGTHALAAVSGMFPIVFFFISLVIGLGAGASVLIGQAWGAKQPDKVKAIAGTALALGMLIGLTAAVLGSVFAREALVALGTPADVLEDATGYARMMMLLMPLLLTFILFTQLLRGVSDTVSPLLALLLSTTVGLALTPALIKGWLGLPPLGIQSAALGGLCVHRRGAGFSGGPPAPPRPCAGAQPGAARRAAAGPRDSEKSDAHRPAHRRADGGDLDLRAGDPGPGQPPRLGGHGRVRRGDPGGELRAVPGALHRHHRLHPGRAGHRGGRAGPGARPSCAPGWPSTPSSPAR